MFETKNIKRYFLVFFLVISLVFSPINFSFFVHISPAQADDLSIEEDAVWSGLHTLSGYITVANDATLTIEAGAIVEFDEWSSLDIFGSLRVEGTPDNPVVFRKKNNNNTKEYYTITSSGGKIHARNIDVSGGGNASEVFMSERNQSPFQYANAMWIYRGAFSVYDGGTLDIEGANFHDNGLAVYAEEHSTDETKIWRSKFSGNEIDLVNDSYDGDIFDARYNWWGDKDGPEKYVPHLGERYPPEYARITGDVNVSDWAKIADFRDPVIVIPGILGSWKKNKKSDLELDPLMGTYNNLIETLDKNGYTLEKDLFPFPYEWHYSNVESAKLLQTKINEIKVATKWPKVDIVAHSMGGLVAREYIGTLDGGGSVDQLITLGTPHNGSPESYQTWDGGEFGRKFKDLIFKKIFQQEAEENSYETVFDYVRKAPILSVRELLPVYDYLRDKGEDTLRTDPNLYPTNTFLENLKTEQNIARLDAVDFTNIVGKMKGEDTISTIRVGGSSIELLNDPEKIVLWGHGKPDGYDSLFGDKGLELGVGDGTVPLTSAEGIASDETIELASSHGDLPTNSAKTVVKKLTGVDTIAYSTTPLPTSYILFMPFSPIDIQIISPSGKRVGKNFETDGIYDEIPGAYYTGFDTQNEFITIPNPEKGAYRILTRGTGSGSYRLEVSSIQEDASGDGVESTKTITGTAELNKAEETTVNVTETNGTLSVVDQNVDDSSDSTDNSTDNTTIDNGDGGKSHKNSTRKKNTTVTTAISYPLAQKFSVDRSNPSENTLIQILASAIPSGENFRTKNVTGATSESENMPLSQKVEYILSPLNHVFFLFW